MASYRKKAAQDKNGGGAQGAVRTIHNEITRSFLEKGWGDGARAGGRTGLMRRLRGRW